MGQKSPPPAASAKKEKTALIIGFEDNGFDQKNPFAKKPQLKNKSLLEQKI